MEVLCKITEHGRGIVQGEIQIVVVKNVKSRRLRLSIEPWSRGGHL